MTELLPVLMNDIIATAPQEQKVRSDRSRIEEMSTPVFYSKPYCRTNMCRLCFHLQYFRIVNLYRTVQLTYCDSYLGQNRKAA